MTQTDPSPQKPNRPEEAIEITLKGDKNLLSIILLQGLMAENPRKIDAAGLDEYIKKFNAIYKRIRDLRRDEPQYFKTIEARETAADELQKEIRHAVDNLASAAEALGGTSEQKRKFFYPNISGSIQSLRNALKQFENLKIEDLSQTNSPLQELVGLEQLQKDKDRLDEIQNELIETNPRHIKESSNLDTYITDLLTISVHSEMFRHRVPKYFISIDAIQQHLRDAVDNLAMAADVLDRNSLSEKNKVFFPKISESIPLLDSARGQFQLPKTDDRSQNEEAL